MYSSGQPAAACIIPFSMAFEIMPPMESTFITKPSSPSPHHASNPSWAMPSNCQSNSPAQAESAYCGNLPRNKNVPPHHPGRGGRLGWASPSDHAHDGEIRQRLDPSAPPHRHKTLKFLDFILLQHKHHPYSPYQDWQRRRRHRMKKFRQLIQWIEHFQIDNAGLIIRRE